MSWEVTKDIILGFLGSGIAGWFMYEMRELRHSVENLNLKLATVLERTSYHERMLEDHNDRIERMEWHSTSSKGDAKP